MKINKKRLRARNKIAHTLRHPNSFHDHSPKWGPVKHNKLYFIQLLLVLLLFVGCCFSTLAFFSNFHPTMEYESKYHWAFFLYSCSIAVLAAIINTFCRSREGIEPFSVAKKFMVTLLFSFLASTPLTNYSVYLGEPTLKHYFSSMHSTRNYTIQSKRKPTGRSLCFNRVVIEEFTYLFRSSFCVGKERFNEIRTGSTVEMKGSISRYGINIYNVNW